jgi:predicted AAA+ superfamily ATPase
MSAKSVILVGLRDVGKTVLLDRMRGETPNLVESKLCVPSLRKAVRCRL